VTSNDPALTRRLGGAFVHWFGKDRAREHEPVMGAEDFSEFSREGVPICMWRVGATDPAKIAESARTGIPVPSNHSATFAPVPEPTLKACVASMTVAVLELMKPGPDAPPKED
jgi:hippurate hydrolase